MATEITLPRLGQGMESGVIVRWLKQEGDTVAKGEPLYELDTDKVTQEVEAEVDGVLQKIVVAEGEVDVGATIAVIETNGAAPAVVDDGRRRAAEGAGAASPLPAEAAPAPEQEVAAEDAPAPTRRRSPRQRPTAAGLKASPLARRIARERGVDLASVTGTGPDGRDPRRGRRERPGRRRARRGRRRRRGAPAGEVEVVQLTSIRKTIARRLTEAWTAPVFQLGVSADMTEVLALREQLVERLAEGDVKPTVNDVLVKLAAVALVRHRPVNATFTGEEIQRHPAAHVGIAVAAPQGLVVPVVRDADRRTVQEIARARADLVGRARDYKLKLPDLEGGTFTISNLGMFGVEQFTAVLNPPQVAILAVGSVKDEAVVRDGAGRHRADRPPDADVRSPRDRRCGRRRRSCRRSSSLVERPALAL